MPVAKIPDLVEVSEIISSEHSDVFPEVVKEDIARHMKMGFEIQASHYAAHENYTSVLIIYSKKVMRQ